MLLWRWIIRDASFEVGKGGVWGGAGICTSCLIIFHELKI